MEWTKQSHSQSLESFLTLDRHPREGDCFAAARNDRPDSVVSRTLGLISVNTQIRYVRLREAICYLNTLMECVMKLTASAEGDCFEKKAFLAIVDVRYFVDKNAKTNKFRENIQSVILKCFYRESIA
jgi:hypothetical protein